MFSPTIAALTFGVIFVAELPDKTALASLMLGARYRASYVFCGIAAAFALHVALALVAGSLLALLPYRWVQGVAAVLFLAGAVLLLRHRDEDGKQAIKQPREAGFWKVAASGFMLILVAEFGDLTQIMTANLAARYGNPLSVGVGAVLALWTVAGIGIIGGRALLRHVPMHLVARVAAVVMLVLAGFSCYEAIA